MKIPIIRIGNSKGIILSKTLIERYGFGEKIEITMKTNHLELKPLSVPRHGWDEAFKQMHERGDDRLLDNDVLDGDVLDDDVLDDDLREEWK